MTTTSAGTRTTRRSHLKWFGVAGLAAALSLTACSSSSDKSGGGTDTGTPAAKSACMTKASDFLKSWSTLPTKLSADYAPLTKKPQAGGTIIRVTSPIPSDNDSFTALQAAASSIGWKAKKISHNGSVEDLNAKFEQAVSEKPDVIVASGQPASNIPHPLADAKAAGIVVALDNILDAPTDNPGFAAVTSGGPTAQLIGDLNAYMFLRDSNCKGNAAVFNLPFPILKAETDAFTKTVHANCPGCKVSYNEIAIADIATPAATTSMVSKLQSSTSTKYVYSAISDLATGLPTALSQAGISGVKIFGAVPDANALASLRKGTSSWWINESPILNGWTELDAALRAMESGKVLPDNGHYPLSLLTPQNVGKGDNPTYPLDYENEFKALWLATA